MYKSAIVNECNEIKYWCECMTDRAINEILASHPEWRVSCIEIN